MKRISGRPWIWILALAVAALTVTPLVAFAHVWTDQADYSPGSVVAINGDNSDGAGYQAGETVHVVVGIPDSFTTSCDTITDASGAWSCQVTLPSNTDAIGLNSYTATGQTSGVSQSGSFTDSGCKNSNAINTVLAASNVGASFTTSGNVATYSFQSFTNENPVAGVPGLIEYCVYTSPLPDSTTAAAIGANGAAFVSSTDASKGEFAFERKGGNPTNVPLDGTTDTMGTATFNTGVPTLQTIILHINDAAECNRVYGVGSTNVLSDTCFVLPGVAQAKLTLVKVVNNSGTSDTTAATAWTLSASGPTPLSGAGGASGTVSPGTYTLAESGGPGAPGWTSSGFNCGAGVVTTITLNGGDDKTCTITNTAVPPKLTLVKVVDHNGTSDTTAATAWTLKATKGTSIISGAGGVSNATADIGNYALTESGPGAPGWTSSGYTCGSSTTVVTSVTLALGDSATCTITNKAVPPKITIVKKATGRPGGGDTFSFAVNGPSPSTQSVTTSTQISGTTFRGDVTAAVMIGSYTISENPNSTWVLTGAVCYSGAEQTPVPASAVNELPPTPTSFTLALGGQETCVFENTLPVTRTQGFWATHYSFTNSMWPTRVPVADQQIVCGTTVVKNITNVLGTGTSNLYGGFWSGISKTTANKARSALDAARMKLVQQLQAAILNRDVFGAADNGLIAQAKADYCGINVNAITSDAGALGQYNQTGEVVALDPAQFALSPADPQKAQTTANKAYWDILP